MSTFEKLSGAASMTKLWRMSTWAFCHCGGAPLLTAEAEGKCCVLLGGHQETCSSASPSRWFICKLRLELLQQRCRATCIPYQTGHKWQSARARLPAGECRDALVLTRNFWMGETRSYACWRAAASLLKRAAVLLTDYKQCQQAAPSPV